MTFTTLVVSIIEFGSPAYGSARKNVLDQLQIIFNEGLRIALGAFKTTRTGNLLNEAGLKDLEYRRTEKTAACILNIMGMADHPLGEPIRPTTSHRHYDDHPRLTRPFSIRAGTMLVELELASKHCITIDYDTPHPWITVSQNVDLSLSKWRKD